MRPSAAARVGVAAIAVSIAMGAGPSAARADVCRALDTGPIPNPLQAGCDVVKTGVHAVSDPGKALTDVVSAPVKLAGDEVMRGLTAWVGNGAAWLVGQAGALIDETTSPRIESPWFVRQYRSMGALAAVFALPLLLVSVLQGVLRRDGGVIVRAAFVQLPLAFCLAAGAVAVVQVLLELTDAMCSQVAASVGNDAKDFFKDTGKALGAVLSPTGPHPLPLFAVFMGALVAAGGAFFVWVELLIRSAAIYVAVLFLPFTFVAMIWPATARWCRRLVELLTAIVLSKFVIVAIMALAAAGLGQSRSGDAFQGVLAGAALMLLAAFSPIALLRLVPLVEAAAHGAGPRSGAGSSTLGPVASPGMVMRRAVDANWGGGGGVGGLRAAPASGGFGSGAVAVGSGMAATQALGSAVRSRAETIGGAATTGGTSQPGEGNASSPREPANAADAAAAPSPAEFGQTPTPQPASPEQGGGRGGASLSESPPSVDPSTEVAAPRMGPDERGPGSGNV